MFKLTATAETATATETRTHEGLNAKTLESLRTELKATEAPGATYTYRVSREG
jgi:hypothetical protein